MKFAIYLSYKQNELITKTKGETTMKTKNYTIELMNGTKMEVSAVNYDDLMSYLNRAYGLSVHDLKSINE